MGKDHVKLIKSVILVIVESVYGDMCCVVYVMF